MHVLLCFVGLVDGSLFSLLFWWWTGGEGREERKDGLNNVRIICGMNNSMCTKICSQMVCLV